MDKFTPRIRRQIHGCRTQWSLVYRLNTMASTFTTKVSTWLNCFADRHSVCNYHRYPKVSSPDTHGYGRCNTGTTRSDFPVRKCRRSLSSPWLYSPAAAGSAAAFFAASVAFRELPLPFPPMVSVRIPPSDTTHVAAKITATINRP